MRDEERKHRMREGEWEQGRPQLCYSEANV